MDLDFLFFWGYNNYRVNNIISTNISWRKKAFFKGGIEIKKLFGNTLGLKPSQIKRIEKLYRKRIPNEKVISYDVARILCETSFEIGRQIGVLINRKGAVEYVIIGNRKQIILPDLSNYRSGEGRLKGLRLVHTHLNFEPINRDDLTDLALLRLDIVASLFPNEKGLPRLIQIAHLLPDNPAKKKWEIIGPTSIEGGIKNFTSFVQSLEEEFSRAFPKAQSMLGKERAILISVTSKPRFESEDSMEELKELAKTSGVEVVDTIIQHIKKPDPKYLMGKGKMQELVIKAMASGADMIIFDQDLFPSQATAISEITELKVIDRTQLILDIFAQHAHSRDGKVQVELAQLKYLLPRLSKKDIALSRLTGGIGARGPGETKLEINRRRVRDRINRLEKILKELAKGREIRRIKRKKNNIPIISIIGYTNAGKSTLLNSLTKSHVLVENKLFATLDTSSKRLRLPREREVIITDTVGFIRDLPPDLLGAFSATLDELKDANLLLHVIDISNPRFEKQIEEVDKLLDKLGLKYIPTILVLNKMDKIDLDKREGIARRFQGIMVSAINPKSLGPLLEEIDRVLWQKSEENLSLFRPEVHP
ncbi:MAG: GTPase HflX [Deltaproteobacteria bacterium]|nr:MAG: GTPase HflX [Deltaproteobacteria bacterium]